MEENEESGISLGDIFRCIGKHIVWILGSSVLVAAVAVLLTAFVLNRGKDTYSITFSIYSPDTVTEDGAFALLLPNQMTYPIERILDIENLMEIQQSDESFSSINVTKIASKNGITLSSETWQLSSDKVLDLNHYTLSASGAYFKSKEQAYDFLKAVAGTYVRSVMEQVAEIDFDASLYNYDVQITYSSKLSMLSQQINRILGYYDRYIEVYDAYTYEGETINNYRSSAALLLKSGNTLDLLQKELSLYNYLCNETESDVRLSIASLEKEKKENLAIIQSLTASLQTLSALYAGNENFSAVLDAFSDYHARIAELTERNAEIDFEIEDLYASIGYGYDEESGEYVISSDVGGDADAFASALAALYDEVTAYSQTCANVITALYNDKTYLSLGQSSVIVEDGGTSSVLIGAVAFVAVFVVATAVFYAIDASRRRKAEAEAEKTIEGETKD